jgi:prepilin-type N-terminal cleavage/methylation domain-containing protein
MTARNRRRQQGFTLVEMLVVIGIIALLISILIPAMAAVRVAAKVASTKSLISTLCSAIERYREDLRYYPGPLDDYTILTGNPAPPGNIGVGGRVTMPENLFLGIAGGLNYTPPVSFDPSNIGKGANLMTPYIQVSAGSTDVSRFDRPFTDSGNISALDTNIPEFVDRFDEPLPILYLRARVGVTAPQYASCVISNGTPLQQYDIRQITAYTTRRIGNRTHLLQDLGTDVAFDPKNTTNTANAWSYFRHPVVTLDPRQKNTYILISAGKDRIYGTADDLCNFGSVVPGQ